MREAPGERMQREIWVKKVESSQGEGEGGIKKNQAFRWRDGMRRRSMQNLVTGGAGRCFQGERTFWF